MIKNQGPLCCFGTEASQKTLEYIQGWNLGGGNLIAGIFDKRRNGRQIAHVSYNGKVWKIPDEKLLYAPSAQELW